MQTHWVYGSGHDFRCSIVCLFEFGERERGRGPADRERAHATARIVRIGYGRGESVNARDGWRRAAARVKQREGQAARARYDGHALGCTVIDLAGSNETHGRRSGSHGERGPGTRGREIIRIGRREGNTE